MSRCAPCPRGFRTRGQRRTTSCPERTYVQAPLPILRLLGRTCPCPRFSSPIRPVSITSRRWGIPSGRIACARSSASSSTSASRRWRASRRRWPRSRRSRSAIRWTTSSAIRDATPKEGLVRLDADTSMSPGSFEAALRAAGGAIARGRRGDGPERRQRLRRDASARPPCRDRGADGLLPVQQRGDRGPPRPGAARRRARRDRRFRRPPRQRHARRSSGPIRP